MDDVSFVLQSFHPYHRRSVRELYSYSTISSRPPLAAPTNLTPPSFSPSRASSHQIEVKSSSTNEIGKVDSVDPSRESHRRPCS